MKKKTKNLLENIVGWYGMTAIVGAYALASFHLVTPDGIFYQLLNLTGSLGILVISLSKKVYQSVVLNFVWTCIAIAALIKIFLRM